MIKILTLNTWQEKGPWHQRWKGILKGIAAYQPEIIGFQEVFNEAWIVSVAKACNYRFWYFPDPQSGLVTLSRHPILDSNYITYQAKSPTEPYRRYASAARIQLCTHVSFCFLNTHLSWLPEEGETRCGQILELKAFLMKYAASDEWILTGDFNTTMSSPEMNVLMKDLLIRDVFKEKNPQSPGFTWDNKNSFTAGASHPMPDRRIDYIFAGNTRRLFQRVTESGLMFQEPDTDGNYPSDHFGVFATFDSGTI